jgi:hypothetical protein
MPAVPPNLDLIYPETVFLELAENLERYARPGEVTPPIRSTPPPDNAAVAILG